MSDRSYGHKYDEIRGKYLSAAKIAKLMRRDIKQAIDDGLLPAEPKYRVRVHNYAGGRSINIRVEEWADAWQDCDGYKVGSPRIVGRGRELCRDHFCAAKLELLGEQRPGAAPHQVLTENAEKARMTLERIHEAYNHDGSDVMTDYFDRNYYGSVEFESPSSAAGRKAEAERLAARRRATDELAAAETKRVIVYGRQGKRTVHTAVQTESGRIRLVCGATLWRSSVLCDGTGQELTCSRCAKRAGLPVRAHIYRHNHGTIARWIVEIKRGGAKLETKIATSHADALKLAGEAIARLGGVK